VGHEETPEMMVKVLQWSEPLSRGGFRLL